ncbi:MAG: hypothetical protein JWN08_2341 [Frankiales bacterium]|jgi:hypothetical protein|nr:hypothetical protein [Frankiales bacterium]
MSLFSKVAKLASSPQGRAAIAKAKDAANDPRNRAKIDDLVGKVKAKGGQRPATPPPTPPVTEVRAEQVRPAPVDPGQAPRT